MQIVVGFKICGSFFLVMLDTFRVDIGSNDVHACIVN